MKFISSMSALALLAAAAMSPAILASDSETHPIAIAIHGGAGTISRANLTAEQDRAYRAKLKEAVDAGHQILASGGASMEAIIAAIQILEDSPFFNAGRGAVYTYDGIHELDASIMDGATREAGAVAGVTTVKSPIALAEKVMTNSVHVMLSGAGAEQFAAEQGLELVENSYFNTDQRRQQLERVKAAMEQANQQAMAQLDVDYKFGTVGAVAIDQQGNVAAGTSTGGMTAKRYGRVGDAPIIGAGTWADNESCAVSATGHGEYFIRYHVAADICNRMKYLGEDVQTAGDAVIFDTLLPAGGTGGVIIVDHEGNVHMPFNTEGMYRAKRVGDEAAVVSIYADEAQ
ncbi:isoaspartyl peptidase/L-asparaginase family protein [Pseudidiomarina taiwanensis]|uniref:Isoaspartyl peptidase n=1 Tax=Pseudidiomarina taiwanensis TaxID=337250 RepID=A0A432ZN26_9GAMM|nr:isoaspartyl peptidase/L-asparaginase [Pseudidiomarina taiwanensis]RUO79268.1 beta-aspartyl-peptidase [Pseudidiomarina taiwanensis]